jgi:hypothetical protein
MDWQKYQVLGVDDVVLGELEFGRYRVFEPTRSEDVKDIILLPGLVKAAYDFYSTVQVRVVSRQVV